MHKAKAFFFVCAGLFLVAASYHLGARSATAQAGSVIGAAFGEGPATGVVGRIFYFKYAGHPAPSILTQPVPGTAAVVATGAGGSSSFHVVLDNGDLWLNPGNEGQLGYGWEYAGNLIGGTVTPETQGTWGSLKARYRGERQSSSPVPAIDR